MRERGPSPPAPTSNVLNKEAWSWGGAIASPRTAGRHSGRVLATPLIAQSGKRIRSNVVAQLNPIRGGESKKGRISRGFPQIGVSTLPIFYCPSHLFPRFLLPLLPSAFGTATR